MPLPSLPLSMEQPPPLLVWRITPGVSVGTGVNGGLSGGVGAGAQMRAPPTPTGKHSSGSRQSVFFSQGEPASSGVLQSPSKPKMSQRSPSGQVSWEQHTPSVQKPLAH